MLSAPIRLFCSISLLLITVLVPAQKVRQSNWQQEVHYQIDVHLNDMENQLLGQWKLTYVNHSPDTLDFLFIHLWPNAYRDQETAFARQKVENKDLSFHYSEAAERGWIKELEFSQNGRNLSWVAHSRYKDIAKLRLSEPLLPGKSIQIESPFRVQLPKVFSRLGHSEQDYFITQWYPKPAVYDVNGWNPMPYLDQGEFYSEFGSFDVTIHLPANYLVTATGEVQGQDELTLWRERIAAPVDFGDSIPPSSEDMKAVRFIAKNVHDFAWFASKRFNVLEREVQLPSKEHFPFKLVMARVFARDPEMSHLDAVEKAIRYYSERVGTYPYPHATVVDGSLRAGGGMEYPMITICSHMGEGVIVHEVGHNWFYAILANNERRYPWMDESINSFYDQMAGGKDSVEYPGVQSFWMDMLLRHQRAFGEQQEIDEPAGDFTNTNYGLVVYGEGARAFSYLQSYLGYNRFDEAMKAYYERWKFKHPLPGDMQDVFEAHTKEDLDWFFQGILGNTGQLDFSVEGAHGEILVQNNGPYAMPVPVTVLRDTAEDVIWMHVPAGGSEPIGRPDGVTNVWVDKQQIGFEPSRSNNSLHPRWTHSFTNFVAESGERKLLSAPVVGWNHYDGWMLGYGIHNRSLNVEGLQFGFFPMYGFKSEEWTGLARLGYQQELSGTGSFMNYNLGVKRFSWIQNAKDFRSYSYTKVSPRLTYRLPRASVRSSVRRELSLSYHYTRFNTQFDEQATREALMNPKMDLNDAWQFIVLDYDHRQGDALNSWAFNAEIEHGRISTRSLISQRRIDSIAQDTSFPQVGTAYNTATHTKLSATLDLKLDIGIQKKPLEIRLFGSYFLAPPSSGQFMHNIGYTGYWSGISDYRMDEFLMHRHAAEGLFRNQINHFGAQSRFVMVVDQTDKWMANAIVTVPLPGKLPIKPYIELLTYADIDKGLNWNAGGSSAMYNIGLELELIPRSLEIYFNLFQSADLTDWHQNNSLRTVDKFWERITFQLYLPDFNRDLVSDLIDAVL